MVNQDYGNKIIETDVLVIGGGIGGPCAAIYASNGGARVVLLEKADVRRSGGAGMGVSMWHQLPTPNLSLDDVVEDLNTSGKTFQGALCYQPIMNGLIDENLVYIGFKDNWEIVHALESWGINMKWDDGKYFFAPGKPDTIFFHGRELKKGIAKKLKKTPITILERTVAIDLLHNKENIVGATALNIRTGDFTVIKAKATVLATGMISRIFNPLYQTSPSRFKMLYQFHAGSGDGVAMALRAGANLVNFEIAGVGPYFDSTTSEKIPTWIVPKAAHIFCANGEPLQPDDCPGGLKAAKQFALEREGRGPFFYDVKKFPDGWHKAMSTEEWHEGLSPKELYEKVDLITRQDCQPIVAKFIKDRGLNTKTNKFQISHYKTEQISIISGVLYDENGRTTANRLYAVGDVTGGSTFNGLAQASVFGMRAGKHIAANIDKMHQVPLDERQVEAQRGMVFAPRKVKRGIEPLEMELKIRDIVERYCGPETNESSINHGLWKLRQVRDKFLPQLLARDNHELMSAIEVRNLFLLAEAHMICARERLESGMNRYRLDYAEKASTPWKEAIVCRLENNQLKVSRRRMPKLTPESGGK
jgi:succinate dehydrogenase/fumarate reductase flavoprotein subunit